MRSCALLLMLTAASLCAAEKSKGPFEGKYRGDEFDVAAKLHMDRDEIRAFLGADIGEGFYVVEVTVTPRTEKAMRVYGDDFFLKTDKDGQRVQPYTPSQIAGRGTLIVSTTTGRAMGVGEQKGPAYGGIGGRPRRLGGDGGMVGTASANETKTESKVESGAGEKENPLLDILKKRAMPEGETGKPVSGLLYFSLEGKQKLKDMELQYRGQAGKCAFRFHP